MERTRIVFSYVRTNVRLLNTQYHALCVEGVTTAAD